jgi:hypothetical protein
MTNVPDTRAVRRAADVSEELRAREPIFHKPEFATTREDFEAMTADDFWEVGASGQRYSREHVIDALIRRGPVPDEDRWDVSDFRCRELGPNTYAVTYTLRQGERITRRLTLWWHTDGRWKALYHQGTVVGER